MRHQTIAAVVLALALLAAACTSDDAADTTATTTEPPATTAAPAATTTTAAPPTTTTAAGPSAEMQAAFDDSLAVKDDFFIAFNSGDAAAVMALFTPNAEFADNFGATDRQWFEELLAWNIAQGTRYTPSNCVADEAADAVTVTCPFITHDVLTLASGGPPVPFTMSMHITADGVIAYQDRFGDPDFNVVAGPFERWMNEHHPEDVEAASFGSWNSLEEAIEHGMLTARYALEWGDYLEDNGCAYDEGC